MEGLYFAIELRAEGDPVKEVDCGCWDVAGVSAQYVVPPQSVRALPLRPARSFPRRTGGMLVAGHRAAVLWRSVDFLCG